MLPLIVMLPVSVPAVVDDELAVALPPIVSVLSSAGQPASISPSRIGADAIGASTDRRRAPQCGHTSSCARMRTPQPPHVARVEAIAQIVPLRAEDRQRFVV